MATAPLVVAAPATTAAQTMEELLRRVDALQRRVDELEGTRRSTARPATATPGTRAAPSRAPAAPPPVVVAQPIAPAAPTPEQTAERARLTREEVDAALRGSLPNSWRIPGTDTSIRLYGFAKANLFGDTNVRNRSDAPSVQSIPLVGSAADRQGGDLNFTHAVRAWAWRRRRRATGARS